MKFIIKRFAIATCCVFMLSGGWFAWKALSNEQLSITVSHAEAAIMPAPFTSLESSQDELIDKIIVLSGLQKQIAEIGDNLMREINQSPDKPDGPGVTLELEKIVAESYDPEYFLKRLREVLKNGSDHERLEFLVQSFSSPLMRKIDEIERQELDFAAFEVFIEEMIRETLPTNRLRLLQELESATYITQFAIELTLGVKRAMRMGAVKGDTEAMNAFDAKLQEQKKELTEKMYHGMILTMAYVYQELDDSELEAYVQFYLTAEGEWFIKQTVNALAEVFRAGSLQLGKRIAEVIKTGNHAMR